MLGVACVLLFGAVVLVVLVMAVVVFPSSRFLVSGGCGWGGGSTKPTWGVKLSNYRPTTFVHLLTNEKTTK